jgi:N-methylhydantoinase A/oxoprolinase/acetone carboxylase beta subunit
MHRLAQTNDNFIVAYTKGKAEGAAAIEIFLDSCKSKFAELNKSVNNRLVPQDPAIQFIIIVLHFPVRYLAGKNGNSTSVPREKRRGEGVLT